MILALLQPLTLSGRVLTGASLVALLMLTGGCAPWESARHEQTDDKRTAFRASSDLRQPPSFSGNPVEAKAPAGWEPWILHRSKRLTRYSLVAGNEGIYLKAEADRAASGLTVPMSVTPTDAPWVEWTWRADRMIEGADNADPAAEDSPLRVVLAFEGDKATLPPRERMFAERVKLLTGRDVPYATLMYIWENRRPKETVIPNPHTTRIQKIVVDSGPERLRQWRFHRRNYVEDYQRVFGKPPGRLIGIGIMTDTDNTGTSITAYYGDIRLGSEESGSVATGSKSR